MAAGDIKIAYAASSNLTVTNLNSLAASQTLVAGWESALIDNTTNLYTDYALTAKITTGASNLQSGEIRMYVVAMLDDSTWPDVFDGTESTETITDAEIRDGFAVLAKVVSTDAGASDVYYLHCGSVASLFGGRCPAKFAVFITHSAHTTTNAIASSGNQVTVKGSYYTVAAA